MTSNPLRTRPGTIADVLAVLGLALLQGTATVATWGVGQGQLDYGGASNVLLPIRWALAILVFPLGYLPPSLLDPFRGIVGDLTLLLGVLVANALIWSTYAVWAWKRLRSRLGEAGKMARR